ncbi:Ig-like domain repeat protein [Variovorax boronicumulans]|uniref:Ig-like domain repeat protein n=1 Tax=Variovorax boronicumulans TaxID=436515 RepID=UPI00339B680E
MVAIVSGNSLGVSLGSLVTLGQRGMLGSAGQGRSGEQSFVNVVNGNLVLQGRDDVLVGRGLDVHTVRTYNSQGLLTDDNGDNWSVGAFGQKVALTSGAVGTAGSTVTRTDRDGAQAIYTWDVSRNGYVSPAGSGAFDTIAYDSSASQFIWTDGETGRIERYQSSGAGRLVSVTDTDGNNVSYVYNPNGTVKSVTDANGEVSLYDYSGANLTQLRTASKSADGKTDVPLTRVRYAYDSANRLASVTVDLSPEDNAVTDGKTYVTTYTYDGTSKRIASVTQSDGTKLSFTYVQAGGSYKVETVTDALGQVTRFAYSATTGTTTVTDPLGAQSTYLYDADGQLLQMRQGVTAGNPSGLSQVSYRYDAAGNVTGVTDGEGREVAYAYDANGNLLKETDSAGNLHTRTYNAANQLLTDTVYADVAVSRGVFSKEASLAEITRYVYAQGNPRLLRFVVSAQGDVTEHRYDSYGQVLTTVRYTGDSYNVAPLDATAVPTEAQMTTWAGSSTRDLRRTERTDRVYDARGALSSSTTYGEVDATGAGVTASAAKTQYVYDQHGWLLKSTEPTGGGTATYVYDGLGRVLSVSAPSLDGGTTANTTVTSYDDAGGKTSVTIATGLVTVSAYDKAGRLVSVTQQSAGTGVLGTTTYAYDKDGNLLMTQDPTGVRKWMLYDEADRKIADIDATGAVIEYVYSASGQLRQTVAYATRLAAPKLAQLVDGAGLPTTAWSATNTTTSLAALRPAASTVQDQKVWRFYDNAGRLAWQVDALGYVTQTTYDGASRILSVTKLANPIDVAPLLNGANVNLGVDPSTLGGIALSVDNTAPTSLGQSVVLVVTVEGATPEGMVTFFDGEMVIGSTIVIDGRAVLVTDRLSIGTHSLRVAYSGDAWRPASVSKAIKKVVGAVTSAVLSSSPRDGLNYGAPVELSMVLTSEQPPGLAAATGEVTFYNEDGGALIGTASVIDGRAVLRTNSLPVGNFRIRAEYSGDASHATATSYSGWLSISPNQTTTTLKISGSSSSLTLAAVVANAGRASGAPGGMVTFYNGTVVIGSAALVNGVATLQYDGIVTAAAFNAVYSGDSSNVGSRTPFDPSERATASPTSITMTASASSATQDASVTLMARVAGAVPAGMVTFFADTQYLGSASIVNGVASLVTRYLPAGSRVVLSAAYKGDANNASSVLAEGPSLQVTSVSPPPASTIVSVDARGELWVDKATVGFPTNAFISFGARPASHADWGSVYVFDGSTLIASGSDYGVNYETGISFNLPPMSSGIHALKLVHVDVSGAVVDTRAIQLSVDPAASVVTVTSSDAPMVDGTQLTLTAKVASPDPRKGSALFDGALAGGDITFYNDESGALIGTTSVINGLAVLRINSLPVGNLRVRAEYSGDASHAKATSYSDVIASGSNPTTTTLKISGNPPPDDRFGNSGPFKSWTLSAVVANSGEASSTAPGGTVTFYNGTVVIGNAALVNGVATLQYAGSVTAAAFKAVYSGDSGNAKSSTPLGQYGDAAPSPTSITLKTQGNSSAKTQVTLTARVAGAVPRGTVTFFAGTQLLGIATVNQGMASLTAYLPVGPDVVLSAAYSGDANNASSVLAAGASLPTGALKTSLRRGDSLTIGQSIYSPDGRYWLTLQWDGNLCLYDLKKGGSNLFWSSKVPANQGKSFAFQSDGNLVLYTAAGQAVWNSATYGKGGESLELQANGNLVLYAADRTVVWSTGPNAIAVQPTPESPAEYSNAMSFVPVREGLVGFPTQARIILGAPLDIPSQLGTLSVFDGSTLIASFLNPFGNEFSLPPMSLGVHKLKLVYVSGAAAATQTIELSVGPAASQIVVTSSRPIAPFGSPLVLTAQVAPRADLKAKAFVGRAATGTVTFYRNGVVLGMAQVINGVATLSVSDMPAGTANITASYTGDENYLTSQTSGNSWVQVTGSPVTLINLTTPSIANDGALSVRIDGMTPPTGLVSFYSGTTLLGTVAVMADGMAILRGVPIPAGTHTFSAVYSGDERNADGALTFTQVVEGTPDAPQVLVGLDIAQDRTATQLYNRNGQLQGTLDGEGYLTEYKYNAVGEQVQTIRYATRAANFASVSTRMMAVAIARASGDLKGLRPVGTNPDDIRTYTFYNARGQLVGQVDGEGFLTETIYDARGNVTQTKRYYNPAKTPGSATATLATIRPDLHAQDQTVTQTWSAANQLLSRTNVEGTVTSFTYDAAGRLVQTTTAAGTPDERISRARYDIQGRLIGELDGRGSDAVALADPLAKWATNGSTHTYDKAGRRTSTTDANGHRTLFFYDALSRLAYSINALGEATENSYDALGQLSEQIVYGSRIDPSALGTLGATTPGGLDTSKVMELLAKLANPAKDSHVVRKYNATGTLATNTDAMEGITSYSYNAFREATASSQTRLNGQVITDIIGYDRRGLKTSTTEDAAGVAATRSTGYDAFGRATTSIDGNGNTGSIAYDRLGRVVTTTDATGAKRTTTYDAFDRVLTQRDALNNTTSYAYSVANRSVTVTTPEGVAVTTVHNRHGQTLSILDGRGNTTIYSYDKSGNLLKIQAPEGVATSTTYDKTGLKLTSTDARGTVTAYAYDAADRLFTRTVDSAGLNLVTTYQYDATGRKISVTDPGGTVTSYKYDLNGQVLQETVDPTGLNLQTVYTYDTDGTTLTVQGPDGRLTRYTYDGAGRRIKEQVDPLGLNLTRSYGYDGQGNVVKAVDAAGNATLYIYNKANRKVFTIDATGGVRQTSYDTEGRISAETTYAATMPVANLNGIAPSLEAMWTTLPTLGAAATQRLRYDRDGRMRFAVDATGAAVESRYDTGNNVIETRAYAQRIDLAKWSPDTDPAVAEDPHDARTRNVYDALGRKTYVVDGTGAVVKQVFDANGNVTERIAYSNRVPVATAATAAALPPAVAAVASTARDQRDFYVYDRANRQTSHTDGVGTVTTQTFDKNGNVTNRASWNPRQSGVNLLTQSEFANGVSDAPARGGAVTTASMAGFAGAVRLASDPAGSYAYKTLATTAGATYTLSVIVEMEDGQPPSFGNARANNAANSFALVMFANGANPLAYTVQNLGGGRYRVSATGVAPASPGENFGVVKYAGNDTRAFRVSGYQLEQVNAGNLTSTTTAAVTAAADAKKQVTRFAYDSAGRLVYTLSPLGQVEKNTYDAAGRVTQTTRYATAINTTSLGAAPMIAQLQALVAPNTAQDQQQYSVYDKSGRLSAAVDALGNVVTFTRDGNGNVNERTAWANPIDMAKWVPGTAPAPTADSARDQRTRSYYDAAGREALTVDALGYALQRQYDAQGRLTYVVRYPVAMPAATADSQQAQLDAAIARASTSGQPLQITAYGYDAGGNRTRQTQAFGQPEAATTQYVYDGIGRLTRTIDPRGVELSQSDSQWALNERLELSKGAKKYLNAAGSALKASELSPTQRQELATLYTTVNDYDAAGHKISVTDALGGVTRSEYDANGHVVKITDPLKNSAVYYFDAAGRVVLSVDPEGYATATSYDMFGQTLSIKRYFNKVAGTPSPAQAPALPAAHASDALTRFEYDAVGRLARTIDAESNAERYTYNALGQRETLTNKLGGVTAYAYDRLGRVVSETLPITSKNAAGQAVAVVNQSTYDAFGNKTNVTEAAGLPEQRVTQFKYDGLNREVEQRQAQVQIYVDGKGWSTATPTRTKTYDANGNLIAVVDPNGGRTRTWFDGSNRKVAEVSATGTLSQWAYDAAGNVKVQNVYGDVLALPVGDTPPVPVNAANVRTTTYEVDANNRVLSSTIAKVQWGHSDPDNPGYYVIGDGNLTNSSFYDANGNVVRQQNGEKVATLTWYDKLGQKVLEVDAMGYGVRWERDANGAVLRETRFASALTTIELSTTSESTLVTAVLGKFKSSAADQITEYSYDRNARVLSQARLNVAYGSVAANGALSEATTSATQRTAYDAMGNKTATTDAKGQRSDMRYDAMGRLLGAQRPGAVDLNGNLVRQVTDYEYDGLNNVRREIRRGTDNIVETDDQIVRYGYDATGVRTSMVTANKDKAETFTYGRDANGNTTAQMVDRLDADGKVSREIVSIAFDAANREVRRFTGTRDAANMPVFDVANTITLGYTAYGELASKRTGSGNAQGQAQEYYDYDNAGRLWRTNSQDGVNKAWRYDLAGNATMLLQSQRVDLRSLSLEAMAKNGTQINPDIMVTLTAYDKDNRAVSVVQPLVNAARPNLVMYAVPVDVDAAAFGGLDITTASVMAANSAMINGPTDKSAAGQVGMLGMTFSGGGARVVTDLEIRGGRNFISRSVFGFTDVVVGSTGVDWTSQIENLYGRVTWRVEVAGNSYYLGSVATWPKTVRPMDPLNSAKRLYVPRAAVNAATSIRLIATVEGSGVEIVVANQKLGTPVENAAGIIFPAQPRETLSGTFMALTEAGVHDGDTIQLYSRARGTSGPFSQTLPVFKAGQGGSSLNNISIGGRYLTRLDGQGSLDMLLVVTSSDGTVKRRQSFQWDAATRQTSSSVAEAKPVFTTDNVAHFTGLTTAAGSPAMIRVTQNPVGRPDLKSQRTYSPNAAGAAGRFDVQFAAGASDVTIELLDSSGAMMDQLIGTVDPGSSRYDMRPAGAMPSSITFRDLPAATKTLLIEYTPLDGGVAAGSVRIPIASVIKSRDGWVWDARALIPAGGARNLYQYSLRFKALDEDDFVLNDATGKARIGAGQGTSATLTANVKHPLLTFDPGVPEGTVLKLRFREKGMTAAPFTETMATRGRVSAIFKWDTIDNHLSPDKEYEFLYDVYNAAGAIIANGEGYFRPGGNDDTNQYARWGIPNTASGRIDPTKPEAINTYWRVQRRQDWDAFGHVVTEMDGNKKIAELRYNTLGLLVDKIGPSVDIRGADGQVQKNVKPTEHYSYDLNGQLVGKRDANGNQSTVEINAAGQAVVEWHPGAAAGSRTKVLKAYDVFGNLRTVTDEIGRVTNNEYDWNNRLKKVLRPANADGTRAFDLYEYDILGQRIAHTNAMGFRERTYYDTMGRVSQYVSAADATVKYTYTYDKTIGSAGGVNTGGWVNTTTDANGKVQTIKNDMFGRAMWKKDLGGHQFTYTYNWFGLIATQRGTSGQKIDYTYFDNGYLGKVVDAGTSTESTFDYDANGNRSFEGFKSTAGNVATVFQWSTVSYDAYNRVTKIKDDRYEINYEYDANGNRRRVLSNYFDIVGQKKDTQDYWYAYDGMNRFTTTMGQRLASGEVWRGGSGDGVTIEYDDAGQRKAATYASDGHREDYAYDGMGNLTTMKMNGVLRSRRINDLAGRVTRYEELFADQTLNVGKDRTWNKDNQLTKEVETIFSKGGIKGSLATTTYGLMKDGTLSTTSAVTNKYDPTPGLPNNGVSITVLNTAYAYEWWDSAKQSSITVDPKSTDVKTPWAPGYSAFTYDVNGHVKTATDRNLTTPRSFSYWTNAEGQVLQRQELIGGKVDPKTGAVNLGGASKSRDHRYFYFDGKRVGNVGNDGVEREDYAQQLARSANALESSDNKYRKFTPTSSADFDENYRPINAGYPGPAPGSYTVRAGDTLENIARSLWGDGQLWYLLAEANGLDGQPSAQLTPNTVLQVPNQVTNFHNTSSTFRPYDPGKAMGDTSPTLPDPMPAPRGKDGGCGGLGQILVIVVAIVATIWTAGASAAALAPAGSAAAATTGFGATMSLGATAMVGGAGIGFGAGMAAAAIGGAVGSIASQGVGIAMGLQDSFSWKGVALGALGAGVTAGVGGWLQGGGLGGAFAGSEPLRVAGRLAIGNIASQGLSIATGLQKSFDWRGVAASAASGYVSAWAQPMLTSLGPIGGDLATRMAGGIMSAAVRGGSIGRALPGIIGDAVGSTIGNALAERLGTDSGEARALATQREIAEQGSGYFKPLLKATGASDSQTEDVLASSELSQLIKTAQALNAAREQYGKPLYQLTPEQQTAVLSPLYNQDQLYSSPTNFAPAQTAAAMSPGATAGEIWPNVIEGTQPLPVITVPGGGPTLVDGAAIVLDTGAAATRRLVQVVGGEEVAGALLMGVQAAIYGVPKTILQLAGGKALEQPKANLADKVSGLLQEHIFDGMGSPDAVKTISDALGNFTVDAVFDAGRGMVRSANSYMVAKEKMGGASVLSR